MKYKTKLVTNQWTKNPQQQTKLFRKAGFKVKPYCFFNDETNLELVYDLKSNTIEQFLSKLEKCLNALSKFQITIWSIVNSEEVILTEEVDLEKLNLLIIPLEQAVINTGKTRKQIETFKLEGRFILERALQLKYH